MKVQNAVVGMEVQVKRDCRGLSDEFLKEGLVCTVDKVMGDGYELRLLNPDNDGGFAWVNASDVRRYNKPTDAPEPVIEPKPKALTLQDIQVGDWVVCSDDRYGLTVGVAYEVLRVHSDDGLYVSNPERPEWVTGFATRTSQFNKILREVEDAAPRMAKSGSESTCRSE